MPELPEVETVRNVLKKDLLGLEIKEVFVNYPEMIKTDLLEFKKNLLGQTFVDIKRVGKWLIFETEKYALLSHLRMEGKYFYTDALEESRHDRVIFKLSNGKYLRYNDVRKFGVMYLVLKENVFVDTPLNKLGPEPFSKDLTVSSLKEKLKQKKVAIKTALLDQEIISGLGNIYVDEVLFKSQISPFKKANQLTDVELEKIISNARSILNEAIQLGGTTIRSYTSSLGVKGSYQEKLLVHTKKRCPICASFLEIKKIGGRSTYYCKNCQMVENE